MASAAPIPSLDPLTIPLRGMNLIEASAGTGKTFAIAALFLRLLLEGRRQIDQIAVVTFTNAASEELKQRIRARLVDARSALVEQSESDPLLTQLFLQVGDSSETMIRRLDNAIRGFDQVAIHTIHSFCQRLLKDRAFASGMPLNTELEHNSLPLLQQIAEDYWRRELYTAPRSWVEYLINQSLSPAALLKAVHSHIGKPYLKIQPLPSASQPTELLTRCSAAFAECRKLWNTHRAAISELLQSPVLNKRSYAPQALAGRLAILEDYFNPEQFRPLNAAQRTELERVSSPKITAGTKKGQPAPSHPFFDAAQRLHNADAELENEYQRALQHLRMGLLHFCNAEFPLRTQHRRQQSFDDLLINLSRAVNSDYGPRLTQAIRDSYNAILIDEFQDTDPIQYAIFHRIYADSDLPVYWVGDPKQAIYSFRGADIFAYLQAPADADRRYTLAQNWRSRPPLIAAVNALFQQRSDPFMVDSIQFHPVTAASKETAESEVTQLPGTPLRLWLGENPESADKPMTKTTAGQIAAQATASDIAVLLQQSQNGAVQVAGRSLRGSDIAVLVRTNRQGKQIRDALLQRGIFSVQHVLASVFVSTQALELERVLLAVLSPDNESLLRAALSTSLLGCDGSTLHSLYDNDAQWELLVERFHAYHQQWRDRGFMFFWEQLNHQSQAIEHLLARSDGERQVTNFVHLAELLQSASHQQRLRPDRLAVWLVHQRQLALEKIGENNDDAQLRLESDADLVQIVTIHKSKGLEYALVYCPYLWDTKIWSTDNPVVRFHDPEHHYEPTVDFGSPTLDQAREWARNEELAENLRLLYVALTRAKTQCTVFWGPIKQAENSALAWLLHPPAPAAQSAEPAASTPERYKAMDAAALRTELLILAANHPMAIGVEDPPEPTTNRYDPPQSTTAWTPARTFPGRIGGNWRITSFSALTAGAHVEHLSELADHDDVPATTPPDDAPPAAGTGHAFPRGPKAGTCLHRIFELWEFTRRDSEGLADLVTTTLANYGYANEWTDAGAALVRNTLECPLNAKGLRLADVTAARRLIELDFHFPLHNVDQSALRQAFTELADDYRRAANSLNFKQINGYMRGFIDLVVEYQGRYYIVDYKSNYLGNDASAYTHSHMRRAMIDHHYWLQYLIYTVALHRYLQLRIADYDYQRHFGGVYYLFLRGMDPRQPGNGVFYELPVFTLVQTLDRCFADLPPALELKG